MWKLKIAEGGSDPYIYTTNNFVGRQIWEFDPQATDPQQLAKVEAARLNFYNHRHKIKPSSDLLWRLQVCTFHDTPSVIHAYNQLFVDINAIYSNLFIYTREKFLEEKAFRQTIPQVKVEDGEEVSYEAATAALKRGVLFYSALQASDGHWPAENAGPMFFMSPLVMCLYITGHLNTIFTEEHRRETLRYIYYHQNEDGGWGFHIEGQSTMFGTVLNYICMRLLGEGPEGGQDNAVSRGRKWILDHGGATAIPSWGKTWLSS